MLLVLPRLFSVVVSSRDQHLLSSLLEVAALSPQSAHQSSRTIVAVIGLLHVNGVVRLFESGIRPDGMPRCISRHTGAPASHLFLWADVYRSSMVCASSDFQVCRRAIWLSESLEKFEPPPGYRWGEQGGSDFTVVPQPYTPPLESHWSRSCGKSQVLLDDSQQPRTGPRSEQ
jgi:hypothetical protein